MAVLENVRCLKFGFCAIFLSLLFEKCLTSCGEDSCERDMIFQSYKGSSGLASCCATDAPNLVSRTIRSTIECQLRCQEVGNCSGVNWKQPNICEMFSVTPPNVSNLSGCKYFDQVVNYVEENCSFPYTYNGRLFYGCMPTMYDPNNECTKYACLVSMKSRALAACAGPNIFNNVTVNLTTASIPDPILVTSVNDWIVIQQRTDGSTSFYLPWLDYMDGFGTHNRNFWLGLERMYQITTSGVYKLRLELRLLNGTWLSAEYDTFYLDDEAANYTLHVSGFSGDGGNWLIPNDHIRSPNGMQFSTYDQDHDMAPGLNCVTMYAGGGGFWFNSCSWIRPNGAYGTSSFSFSTTALALNYQLSASRMMMKAV